MIFHHLGQGAAPWLACYAGYNTGTWWICLDEVAYFLIAAVIGVVIGLLGRYWINK